MARGQLGSVLAPRHHYCFFSLRWQEREPLLCSCFITYNSLQMAFNPIAKKDTSIITAVKVLDATLHSCVHSFVLWYHAVVFFQTSVQMMEWLNFFFFCNEYDWLRLVDGLASGVCVYEMNEPTQDKRNVEFT